MPAKVLNRVVRNSVLLSRVAGLLAIGLGWLRLEALPLLIGFAISQLAVLLLWNESGKTRDPG